MWEPNEIRVLRWFMRFAGVGLILPGAIYTLSWPDTIHAFSLALGPGAATVAAGVTVAGSLAGGLTFLFARYARPGAAVAVIALLLGSFVHLQWMRMMQDRLNDLPSALSDQQTAQLTDTILFAANAQTPHILKNLVLVGVCVVIFMLAPRLCGDHVEGQTA